MPASKSSTRRNKHLIIDQQQLTQVQQILGAKTETEAIALALAQVISEDERNRRAWAAHEELLETAQREGLIIKDVFGRLEGR